MPELPEPCAATALLLAWMESECALMPTKRRLDRLQRVSAILERRLRKRPTPIRGRQGAEAAAIAWQEADAIFKEALPRLMAP